MFNNKNSLQQKGVTHETTKTINTHDTVQQILKQVDIRRSTVQPITSQDEKCQSTLTRQPISSDLSTYKTDSVVQKKQDDAKLLEPVIQKMEGDVHTRQVLARTNGPCAIFALNQLGWRGHTKTKLFNVQEFDFPNLVVGDNYTTIPDGCLVAFYRINKTDMAFHIAYRSGDKIEGCNGNPGLGLLGNFTITNSWKNLPDDNPLPEEIIVKYMTNQEYEERLPKEIIDSQRCSCIIM